MQISKSNPPVGVLDSVLKPAKPSTSSFQSQENALVRMHSLALSSQHASISPSLPTGIVLTNLLDSIVLADVVSTIGHPVDQPFTNIPVNKEWISPQGLVNGKLNEELLTILASSHFVPVATLSRSDAITVHNPTTPPDSSFPVPGTPSDTGHESIANKLSVQPLGEATLTSKPSKANEANAVISEPLGNVRITKFGAGEIVGQFFRNTELSAFTITTTASSISSLSLGGRVEFIASGTESATGITVSIEADSNNLTLLIRDGESVSLIGSNVINLGNDDNFIFNATGGSVYVNLGAGKNAIILAGMGASGEISFATNDAGSPDFVAIAANGVPSLDALATIPLLTITGLNGGDAISFLSDLGSPLTWSGGSADAAQVQLHNGDLDNLVAWLEAAKAQTTESHSVSWFYFEGATYILEMASTSNVSHEGDTLVRLTGTVSLADAQLSQGLLQLVS